MGEAKWTAEQLEAITEKGCNLLVAAAAGAGKTAVLVERIIRKIMDEENPVDIDRLLVVTFTNAAATEMRERIADAISGILEKNPDSKNIQRQLTLLSKASITTIHSFCLEVIRSNFQLIDIDPDFRIADETEIVLMKLEVLDELFEEQYEKEGGNEDFFELLECYGGNRDDRLLMDMVLNIHNFIQSSPWPENWLNDMVEKFNLPEGTDFSETVYGKVLINSVKLEVEGFKEMMAEAVEVLKYAEGLEKYLPVFLEDLSNLEGLLNSMPSHSWDALFNLFQNIEFKRLPNAAKNADKEKQEHVKKIRDEIKKGISRIKERIFYSDSAGIAEELKTLYPIMKCLANIVIEFGRRYAEKKNRKSLVDFNDLEHFCLDILSVQDNEGQIRPSKIALKYKERFEEILVDEYQDSNLVQEIIINMISRGDRGKPNVFMVGDVKQSIYRFRQAKPELFLEKYNSYSLEKGALFRKILLFKNFRSRKEVVDAVNFIFKQIMSPNVGELDYTDEEALNPGAVFEEITNDEYKAGGEAELHLIQSGGEAGAGFQAENNEEDSQDSPEQHEEGQSQEDGADTGEITDNMQCEARLVAMRIKELMGKDENGKEFCVFDKSKKEYRKLEYRDIVILLRTTRNWADVFAEELSLQGIPAFADTGTGFFKTSEIQVILSLLQIIDNPLQDIPLLAVLRSPIFSFTADELAELRLADKKELLYDALLRLAEGDSSASKKAAGFLENLNRWRDMALYMSTDQLLWQLYNETGYYAMVGAMPSGEQRQANLRILFDRARQFEETSYKGLFNFINFIDKLKSSQGDMGSAKILGENDNVVRIMSIHKSKGLEFPVVILAGCGKKFNLQDMNTSILIHQELGFGPDVVDYRKRLSYPSAPKNAIREKLKTETLSEEMRILYVALTRAREKLIITGIVNDVSKSAEKWAKAAGMQSSVRKGAIRKLPSYKMLKSSNYLDWIGSALISHKDCGILRDIAGVDMSCQDNENSSWHVKIWNKTDVLNSKSQEEQKEDEFFEWLEELSKPEKLNDVGRLRDNMEISKELTGIGTEENHISTEEIIKKLSWNYAHEKAVKIPAKVSVTELKRRFEAELAEDAGVFPEYMPALIKKPMFLEEKKGLSAAEAGTVLHFVMQHLDYKRDDIEAQIEQMIERDLLTEQQAKTVDVRKIRKFLSSPLGKRIAASDSVNREVPFNIEIPCHELYKDMEDKACKGETLLLQGVIDCFFEEPDGIVLVDYKTDHVPEKGTEVLKERYRLQIYYYTRALELLAGKKVKEKYIYLFSNGQLLEF